MIPAGYTIELKDGTLQRSSSDPFRFFHVQGGTLILENITLRNGRAPDGGAILLAGGSLSLQDSQLLNNQAPFGDSLGMGGAILASGTGSGPGQQATIRIERTTFRQNHGAYGGALYTYLADLEVIDSTFERNTTNASGFSGGGALYVDLSTARIERTLLANNSADGVGGGLVLCGAAQSVLRNVTFYGNEAPGGSALYLSSVGDCASGTPNLTASFVTVAQHASGPALAGNTFTATMKETLLIETTDPACDSSFTTSATWQGTNLEHGSSSSCEVTPVSNLATYLGSLANNGGPTRTAALRWGSPAINAAQDCRDAQGNTVSTDQRGTGYSRPAPNSGQCDVGAFEFQGFPNPDLSTSANSSLTNSDLSTCSYTDSHANRDTNSSLANPDLHTHAHTDSHANRNPRSRNDATRGCTANVATRHGGRGLEPNSGRNCAISFVTHNNPTGSSNRFPRK